MGKALRFGFGSNWQKFLTCLDEERIIAAENSLRGMLEVNDLKGKKFLDIGCGSGLFSLAARRLGASVYSFDYDEKSVDCTDTLKQRYFPGDSDWIVKVGDVLDKKYLSNLGTYDIVYSWGVLHHTGSMWQAMENIVSLVAPNGKLFIAIYNDQGGASNRWAKIKKLYNNSPSIFRPAIVLPVAIYFEIRTCLIQAIRLKNPLPFKYWKDKKYVRGMSVWHDYVDWVGGWPFEFAKPEKVFDFYHKKNFMLKRLKTCGGGHGCNEFVFEKLHMN